MTATCIRFLCDFCIAVEKAGLEGPLEWEKDFSFFLFLFLLGERKSTVKVPPKMSILFMHHSSKCTEYNIPQQSNGELNGFYTDLIL